MSQYPSFVFPSCPMRFNRRNQQIFTDYGCWEGVNADVWEGSAQLMVKKARSSSSTDHPTPCSKVNSERFLRPVHSFMLMDDPPSVQCLIDDCFKLNKNGMVAWKVTGNSRMKSKRKVHTIVAQKHLANIACDCPEITNKTFKRMMRDCCFDMQLAKNWCSFRGYCQLVDPMMCDVGRNFLNDILLEELQNELKKNHCDRDFVGGCLRCHELPRSSDRRTECVIFCAQGQCLDELSIRKMDVKVKDEPGVEPMVPKFSVIEDIRQTLSGRILQIDTVMMQGEYDFMVATRSDYFILINGYSHCERNDSISRSKDPICSLSCVKMSGSSRVSNIALNPMILGECAIATEDGVVRLWNAEAFSQRMSEKNLQILVDERLHESGLPDVRRQVCFAAHPRQFYLVDEYKARLFDIRRRHASVNLFDVACFSKFKWREKIYCIESGRNMGSEYECLIATDCNLFLLDQRYCNQPLMQLGTNMSRPPCYMKSYTVNEIDSMETTVRCNNRTSAIIVANQHPQEVYLYQLSKSKQITLEGESDARQLPYQCSQPTQILEGFSTVRKYATSIPLKHYSYLMNRASKSIVGLDALNFHKTSMSSTGGLIVLQMNSVGDIGYQTLHMSDRSDACSGVVHGGISPAEQHLNAQLCEMKRENYDQWIGAATSGENNVLARFILPHVELKLSSQRLNKLFGTSTVPATTCHLCTAHRTYNASDEKISKCENCNVGLATSERIQKLWQCDEDHRLLILTETENDDCSADDLDLINTGGGNGCNSFGELLRCTWSGNYEDFWESQRQEFKIQREAERQAQNVRTLDLNSASIPEQEEMTDFHQIARSNNDSNVSGDAMRNSPVSLGQRKRSADQLNTASLGVDSPDKTSSAQSFSFFSPSFSSSKRKKGENATSSIGF